MKILKLLTCATLFGFCCSLTNMPALADESFSIGVYENEGDWGHQDESKLELWQNDAALRPILIQTCEANELQKCLENKTGSIYGFHFLPLCSKNIDLWCATNFSIIKNDGTTGKLSFVSYLNNSKIEGNSKINLIPGTSPSIWKSEEEGTYYLLKLFVTSGVDLSQNKRMFKPEQFVASISEIKEIKDVPLKLIDGSHSFLECPKYQSERCVVTHDISSNTRFSLKFLIPEFDAAWVYGRLDQPVISKKSMGRNRNEITITAGTLSVPEFKSKITRASVLKAMEIYKPDTDGVIFGLGLSGYLAGSQQGDFNTLDFWLENSDDMATGVSNYWNFRTMSLRDEGGGYWSRCNTISSFSGLLTTNATVYDGFTPTYLDSYLEYQIGAPHYLSDGSVFEGKYYLNLRADLAKCLYGIKNKSARATVRITYADKAPQIETESLKNSNGWYNLKVDGINFSSPKIKVKLN